MVTLKVKPENFQAIVDGKKPFEIRAKDRDFNPGEIIKLVEFTGSRIISKCKQYNNGCKVWERFYISDDTDCWLDSDTEAIDMCGKNRALCREYIKLHYSGRECIIKIKDVFDLQGAGLGDYVAFTFDIQEIKDREDPYCYIVEDEEKPLQVLGVEK